MRVNLRFDYYQNGGFFTNYKCYISWLERSEAAYRTPPGSFALCESEASTQSAQLERKSTTRYGEET